MKIVFEYTEGSQVEVKTLRDIIEHSRKVDKLNSIGVLFHQRISDNMDGYNESSVNMSNYVSYQSPSCKSELTTMFNEDITGSALVHGVVKSRKTLIPFGVYPSGGYHHYELDITEDRYVDQFVTKLGKAYVRTTFLDDELRDYVYDYLVKKLETRGESRHPRRHDIAVSAEVMVTSDNGVQHVEPVEWLCYFENGHLSCEYMQFRGILHPIEEEVIENGLMDIFDRGFTITVL